jgi:hypothetical protein
LTILFLKKAPCGEENCIGCIRLTSKCKFIEKKQKTLAKED